MLSPKPLDEIQPNLVCEWGVQRQTFFAPPPRALGRGQKVKYHLISVTRKIQNISDGIFFLLPGHARGVGLWGAGVPRGGGGRKISNMVMWHIKLTGMTSRTECK